MEKMLDTWGKLLEIIAYRHRLLENVHECDILLNSYTLISQKIGVDDCHAFLRPVSFEYAQLKGELQNIPLTLKQLLEDESRVDR